MTLNDRLVPAASSSEFEIWTFLSDNFWWPAEFNGIMTKSPFSAKFLNSWKTTYYEIWEKNKLKIYNMMKKYYYSIQKQRKSTWLPCIPAGQNWNQNGAYTFRPLISAIFLKALSDLQTELKLMPQHIRKLRQIFFWQIVNPTRLQKNQDYILVHVFFYCRSLRLLLVRLQPFILRLCFDDTGQI